MRHIFYGRTKCESGGEDPKLMASIKKQGLNCLYLRATHTRTKRVFIIMHAECEWGWLAVGWDDDIKKFYRAAAARGVADEITTWIIRPGALAVRRQFFIDSVSRFCCKTPPEKHTIPRPRAKLIYTAKIFLKGSFCKPPRGTQRLFLFRVPTLFSRTSPAAP